MLVTNIIKKNLQDDPIFAMNYFLGVISSFSFIVEDTKLLDWLDHRPRVIDRPVPELFIQLLVPRDLNCLAPAQTIRQANILPD